MSGAMRGLARSRGPRSRRRGGASWAVGYRSPRGGGNGGHRSGRPPQSRHQLERAQRVGRRAATRIVAVHAASTNRAASPSVRRSPTDDFRSRQRPGLVLINRPSFPHRFRPRIAVCYQRPEERPWPRHHVLSRSRSGDLVRRSMEYLRSQTELEQAHGQKM